MKKRMILFVLLLCMPLVLAAEEDSSVAGDIVNEKLSDASNLVIVIGVLSIGCLIYFSGKKKKWLSYYIPKIFTIIGVLLIAYSLYYFNVTGAETEGITVCEAGECFWAAHIHAEIHASVCGEEIKFGLEKGSLSGTHTHKERGKVHFHERLPVDPETKEVIDFELVTMDSFFKSLGIIYNTDCLGDKCTADLCNGELGELIMTVNGKVNNDLNEYIWKDGDEIEILFK